MGSSLHSQMPVQWHESQACSTVLQDVTSRHGKRLHDAPSTHLEWYQQETLAEPTAKHMPEANSIEASQAALKSDPHI